MPPIYKVWITPLSLVSFDGRAVDIVASEMAQKVLRQQCYNELLEAFRETVGFDVELNFITELRPPLRAPRNPRRSCSTRRRNAHLTISWSARPTDLPTPQPLRSQTSRS